MGWFLFGVVVGFVVACYCVATVLERIYPDIYAEFRDGETTRKMEKWEDEH